MCSKAYPGVEDAYTYTKRPELTTTSENLLGLAIDLIKCSSILNWLK